MFTKTYLGEYGRLGFIHNGQVSINLGKFYLSDNKQALFDKIKCYNMNTFIHLCNKEIFKFHDSNENEITLSSMFKVTKYDMIIRKKDIKKSFEVIPFDQTSTILYWNGYIVAIENSGVMYLNKMLWCLEEVYDPFVSFMKTFCYNSFYELFENSYVLYSYSNNVTLPHKYTTGRNFFL